MAAGAPAVSDDRQTISVQKACELAHVSRHTLFKLDCGRACGLPAHPGRMTSTKSPSNLVAARLELALNEALLGRGITSAIVQRNYRVSREDARRLMALRDVCFDALAALSAPPAALPLVVAAACDDVSAGRMNGVEALERLADAFACAQSIEDAALRRDALAAIATAAFGGGQ